MFSGGTKQEKCSRIECLAIFLFFCIALEKVNWLANKYQYQNINIRYFSLIPQLEANFMHTMLKSWKKMLISSNLIWKLESFTIELKSFWVAYLIHLYCAEIVLFVTCLKPKLNLSIHTPLQKFSENHFSQFSHIFTFKK